MRTFYLIDLVDDVRVGDSVTISHIETNNGDVNGVFVNGKFVGAVEKQTEILGEEVSAQITLINRSLSSAKALAEVA